MLAMIRGDGFVVVMGSLVVWERTHLQGRVIGEILALMKILLMFGERLICRRPYGGVNGEFT